MSILNLNSSSINISSTSLEFKGPQRSVFLFTNSPIGITSITVQRVRGGSTVQLNPSEGYALLEIGDVVSVQSVSVSPAYNSPTQTSFTVSNNTTTYTYANVITADSLKTLLFF